MVNYMTNTLYFRTEKGGVSNKARTAIKSQASKAVGTALDVDNLKFEYVEDKACYVMEIGTDATTGNPVYVTLDLKVTDMHPSDRAARKSRAGKSKPAAKVEVPDLFE